MRAAWVFLAGATLIATPAVAQQTAPPVDDPLAPLDSQPPRDSLPPASPQPAAPAPPQAVSPADEAGSIHPYVPPRAAPKDWQGVFAAIRAGDWLGAQLGIAALPDGPLKPVAKAQLYTARNSPRQPQRSRSRRAVL